MYNLLDLMEKAEDVRDGYLILNNCQDKNSWKNRISNTYNIIIIFRYTLSSQINYKMIYNFK